MKINKNVALRRLMALALIVSCLSSPALAAQTVAQANDLHPLTQAMEPLSQLFQKGLEPKADAGETIAESPSPEQLAAVQAVQKVSAAAAGKAALAYFPNYAKSVTYNRSAAIPAMALSSGIYLGEYKITFYCPCSKCCGKSTGITATGTRAQEGRTIAVDKRKIPLGSKIYIKGLGDFIAEDVGGAVKGNKIDVFVSSHAKAYQIGVISSTSVYLMK